MTHFVSSRLFITAAAAAAADQNQDNKQQNHADEDEEDSEGGDVPVRLEQLFRLQSGHHVCKLILKLFL